MHQLKREKFKKMMNLYCPRCKETLEERNGGFYCKNCLHLWVRREGILSFLSESYPTEESGNLNKFLSEISDMTGIEMEDYLASRNSGDLKRFANALRSNRADGLYFLPVSEKDILLDMGCGPGSLSIPAAGMCGHVFAVDHSLYDLRFLEIRKRKENIQNITTIHGEPSFLPFRADSFDYIAMNGAVEYMGNFVKEKDPLLFQREVLGIMHNLLKKGGHLFLSAPNRYGLDFFYRERDMNGLYFTSIVPRFVANLVMLLLRKRKYSTYSHTLKGYRKLLNEAGYENIRIYYVWPDFRNPKYIVPQENRNIFVYYRENFMKMTGTFEYWFFKAALRLGIEDFFVPHLIMTAKK